MWKLKRHFENEFLSQEQLENLRFYKYAATDKSLVSKYILQPYWSWAVTLLPTWIAPNLVTLSGLILMMLNVLIIICVVPDLLYTDETPRWIYFSFAAGLWLYSTLDNMDGKQARRTGTSSPLGELFDHGCDAINCTYVVLLQAAALGLGHSTEALVLYLVMVVGFYLSTAEEYFTGVLYLGIVNGPTEGIMLSCFAFIWSGIFGAGSWHVPLADIPLLSFLTTILPGETTCAQIFVWGMVFFFAATHCPMCFYSIYKASRGESVRRKLYIVASVFGPIASYSVAISLWAWSPYSIILEQEHFILFTVTVGIMFGFMASNIILAHLTKSPFPSFYGLLGALWLMAILIGIVPRIFEIRLVSATAELYVLWVFFALSAIVYGIWASTVINKFCEFLGIRCLKIPHSGERVAVSSSTQASAAQEHESLLQAQEEGSASATKSNANNYNTF
ncbi:hypothetical protein VTP01DRAFT_8832 [Rhizomucor pusillus]|uniref:uncharacterized protein n=1 Tax=Rhizomucor pusillus TaxID=4840 RepID=UPI0037439C69